MSFFGKVKKGVKKFVSGVKKQAKKAVNSVKKFFNPPAPKPLNVKVPQKAPYRPAPVMNGSGKGYASGGAATVGSLIGNSAVAPHSGSSYASSGGNSNGSSPNAGTQGYSITGGGSIGGVTLNDLQDLVNKNNAAAQQAADKQNAFNAAEADKNRKWQEEMSNTAHQREVADLQKAGLNPVLSAGGAGAATTSGATASGDKADTDMSIVHELVNLVGHQMNQQTTLSAAAMGANAQVASAGAMANAQMGAAQLNANAHISGAQIAAQANKYQTNMGMVNNLVGTVAGALSPFGKFGKVKKFRR